jgi:hypothetical protein
MKKVWVLLVLSAGLQASAAEPAGQGGQSIAPPKRIPDPVVNTMKVPAGDPVTVATLPRELRRVVVADAAKQLNVSENAVVLARAEQVTWSDGSLGCPKPGMSYTQALVPGYRVVARTADREMLYHTDSRGLAIRCDETLPVRGARPPDGAPGNDAQPRTNPPPSAVPDR